jgi:hypothetical protein
VITDQQAPIVHTVDVISSSTIILTWATVVIGFLPVAAAVAVSIAGVVYYVLAIYSHPAMRDWYHRRCERKVLKKKISLLKAQLLLSKYGALDQAFWDRAVNETQITLAEIRDHIDGTKSRRPRTPASQGDDV